MYVDYKIKPDMWPCDLDLQVQDYKIMLDVNSKEEGEEAWETARIDWRREGGRGMTDGIEDAFPLPLSMAAALSVLPQFNLTTTNHPIR